MKRKITTIGENWIEDNAFKDPSFVKIYMATPIPIRRGRIIFPG
jgi:hypothetical protein